MNGEACIAFVESPLQAFNLLEFHRKHPGKIDFIVVNKNTKLSSENYRQMSFSLREIACDRLIFIEFYPVRNPLACIFYLWRAVILARALPEKKIKLIGGEYRSLFFWSLASKLGRRVSSIFILDDGTATLRINRKNGDARASFGLKGIVRDYLLRAMGFSLDRSRAISFFTAYDIRNVVAVTDEIIPNDYSEYRSIISRFPPDDGVVFIIGTPLYEAGVVGDVDVEVTMAMIDAISREFGGKKILYVSHRREREDKLRRLCERVEIVSLGFPFELYSLVNGKALSCVAGFYSSLFDNLAMIFGRNISIQAYELDLELVNEGWKDFVSSVYGNYRKSYPEIIRIIPFSCVGLSEAER